ncbi:MAG: phosphate signaling complex protein PhoU [Deltaproteobacteria bacterium]|nr:phosphate signaling complex protein PhoU [Deltaproteobacteria bacterium]
MARRAYHKAIEKLENDLIEMSKRASTAITESIDALKNNDIKKAKEIIKNDAIINKTRFDIEEECIHLIATQQPMAVDLRIITSIINITTELERIADHAEGIAKICVMINGRPLIKPLVDIPLMGKKGISMLERVMVAFTKRDADSARAICAEDDDVDEIYERVYKELLHLMIEDPDRIEGGTYLTWASHNLERIADRVTNIAERVVYMATGKMDEMNVSSY